MDTPGSKAAIVTLFMMALFVSCFDVYAIPVGGIQLKMAYLVFPFYVILFIFVFGLQIDVIKLIVATIFLLSLLPSVIFSTSPTTSIAFFLGAVISVSITFIFCRLVMWLQGDTIVWMMRFYRFSIYITAFLFVTRIEDRGHFVLYEPSYYAIYLIPYFCIVLNRIFIERKKSIYDLFLFLVAIATTQSASMIIYIVAIILYFMFISKKITWRIVVGLSTSMVILLSIVLNFTERGNAVFIALQETIQDPLMIWPLLIVIAGNRIQRVIIALQTFSLFPLQGVGLGALKAFSGTYFVATDFDINGASAWDFSTETNATNVFLEIGAEGGIFGLVAYVAFLLWVVLRGRSKAPCIAKQIEIAVIVTMAALLIESGYLRTYVWALYGILLGLKEIRVTDTTNRSIP